MKLKQLEQNLDKEKEGVWVEWEGVKLRIARSQNPLYQAKIAKEQASNRERKERKEPIRDAQEFWIELLAETVLRDWSGVDGEDGKPLPYNIEEGVKTLSNPRLSDLLAFIEDEFLKRKNFTDRADSSAEKNS